MDRAITSAHCPGGRGAATRARADRAAEIPRPGESLDSYLSRQRPPVMRYVTSLVGRDIYLAEDITQEAITRAWLHADRLRWRERPVLPWLLRIARNLAIDAHRKDRAVPVGISSESFVEPAHAGIDLAEAVVNRRMLVGAMSRIPPVEREILVQVHLLGRGGEDVARRLRIPRGTVKSRTYKAVRTLRAELGLADPAGTGSV